MQTKRNRYIAGIALASIFVIAILSIWSSQTTNSIDAEEIEMTVSQITGDPKLDTGSGLKYFTGNYSGSFAIFSSTIQFPVNEIIITSDNRIQIKSEGLDTRILNDSEYAINGQYPIALLEFSGDLETADDGTVRILISQISHQLGIGDKALEPEISQQLFNKLLTSSGIQNTEINELNPLIFNTQFIKDLSGSLQIITTSSSKMAQQPYIFFNGSIIS